MLKRGPKRRRFGQSMPEFGLVIAVMYLMYIMVSQFGMRYLNFELAKHIRLEQGIRFNLVSKFQKPHASVIDGKFASMTEVAQYEKFFPGQRGTLDPASWLSRPSFKLMIGSITPPLYATYLRYAILPTTIGIRFGYMCDPLVLPPFPSPRVPGGAPDPWFIADNFGNWFRGDPLAQKVTDYNTRITQFNVIEIEHLRVQSSPEFIGRNARW